MKRKIFFLLIIVILLITVGCGNKDTKSENSISQKEANDISTNRIPDFNAEDLFRNSVTEDIFKEYSLTMINIWGTYCGPCIREMPDLGELYNELKEIDVNLVGIVVDVSEEKNRDTAIKIIESSGVEFINIIPDNNLTGYLYKNISAIPTTIFVNSNANIIGEPIVGSMEKEEYKRIILKRLKEVK